MDGVGFSKILLNKSEEWNPISAFSSALGLHLYESRASACIDLSELKPKRGVAAIAMCLAHQSSQRNPRLSSSGQKRPRERKSTG
eukprot:2765302-Amphidinium_carterae.1